MASIQLCSFLGSYAVCAARRRGDDPVRSATAPSARRASTTVASTARTYTSRRSSSKSDQDKGQQLRQPLIIGEETPANRAVGSSGTSAQSAYSTADVRPKRRPEAEGAGRGRSAHGSADQAPAGGPLSELTPDECKLMTAAITRCTTVDELIACISRRLPPPDAPAGEGRLNDIHVAAAFTKLVAFCGDALPLDVVPAIAPLVRHALGLVERRRLGGRELASLIYASAKLNLDASGALECGGGGSGGAVTKEAWWAALWAASEATMASANLQDLSNSIWAAGRLRRLPPDTWFAAWYSATAPALRSTGSAGPKAQHAANCLWGLARVAAHPPQEWWEAFWESSRELLRESNSQHLSNLMWAAARMQVVPPGRWLRALWAEWRRQLPELQGAVGGQHLANTLWAASMCRVLPPPSVLPLFYDAIEAELHTFSAQSLSNILWSCACLGLLEGDRQPPFAPRAWRYAMEMLERPAAPQQPHDPRWLSQLFQVSLVSRLLLEGRLEPMGAPGGGECPNHRGLDPCNTGGAWRQPPAAAPAAAEAVAPASAALAFPSEQLRSLAEAAYSISVRESAATALDNTMIAEVADGVRAVLSGAGLAAEIELGTVCPEFRHVVDIAVSVSGGRRLAVQVDGKTRYLRCADTRWWVQDGSTAMRDRCLASAGWEVVIVPCPMWRRLGSREEKEAFLRERLFPAPGGGGRDPPPPPAAGGVAMAR